MAKIGLGSRVCDIDLMAFDKDGTLIDFYHLWGQRARRAVEAVVARVDGDAALAELLYKSIGYDPVTGLAAGDGPLAIASMPKLCTLCAVILYQRGLDWHEAEKIAQESFAAGLGALPTADLVKPAGDVAGLFRRLTQAGVKIAVVTSDDRVPTLATLRLLGVEQYVSHIVCGNDPIPNKPAPEALFHLSRELGVALDRIMMIGDTVGDLTTGTNAGVACRVGLLSGAGNEHELAPHADAILGSIDEIHVLATDGDHIAIR